MVNYLGALGERLLSRLVPRATAEAAPCCGGGCAYEYRCFYSPFRYCERRYCCYDCNCRKSCGSWQLV